MLLANLFFACKDDYEDYSASPNDILAFSHDTLSFDTAISTIGSATKTLMIFNRNKKPLLISSISLKGAGSSGFRINVDGQRGSDFQNVEIRSKDSLFVFIEVTLEENNGTVPIQMLDSIVFITNTIRQQVILEAYGQDAYIYKEGIVIDSDSTLQNDKPYLIYDSLVVKPNATLTIREGTTLYLHDKVRIDIYGRLKIEGAQGKPVVIRGDRLDKVLNIPYDRQPGLWNGIRFHTDSYENEINHAHIRNGQFGILCDSADVSRPKLKVSNTVLTNVYNHLLEATNCDIEFVNSELSNAGGALTALTGGSYRFTHCTLANYFSWSSRSGASVQLGNYKKGAEGVTPLPLLQAEFLNCIVYGSYTNEFAFNKAEEEDAPGVDFNYRFDYCLVKIKYEDLSTNHFSNYILNQDPKFAAIDRTNFIYNYHLEQTSPAINAGSASYAASPDMDGVSRPQGDNPDLGAYEWVATE